MSPWRYTLSEARNTGPWIVGVLVAGIAIGFGVWRLSPAPAEIAVPAPGAPVAEVPAAEASPAPAELPLEPVSESYAIPIRGRIAISASSFAPDVPVALDLELPDAIRGSDTRPVRVAAVDGRQMRTTASVRSGAGSGIRLELAPGWLVPGRYLIEVTTDEKTHFPMRRYVLEVR